MTIERAVHVPHQADLKTILPFAESELRTKVHEAVGAASTCWESLSGTGVFDSDRALTIARELIDDVLRLTRMGEPQLGCATTEQLLNELRARIETGAVGLNYRTVDA